MTTEGKLLVIDGPDGAGKTTALDFIVAEMRGLGKNFAVVNVLKDHCESARMRAILTDSKTVLSRNAELLLYAAAITNTYDLEIKPRLERGMDVIVDRGPLSNFAYQIQAVDHELFPLWLDIHKRFICDATMILTVDLERGLSRCKDRDGVLDRVESRPIEFHQKMLNAYLQVMNNSLYFSQLTGDVKIYCNNGTLEELRENCANFVQGVFSPREVSSSALVGSDVKESSVGA